MFEIVIKQIEEKTLPKSVYRKTSETGGKDGEGIYSYVTEDVTQDVVTEIYSQKVETLDLAAIVAVVNNIRPGVFLPGQMVEVTK